MNAAPAQLPPSAEECLRAYLEGGRAESEFTRLVGLLGGLAYQAAFHVTGDQGLAEEASQGVFVILARKAKALKNHPSLGAWVFRTARYEADKILKREVAHRRRLEKFTLESMNEVGSPEVLSRESWRLLDESIDRLSARDRALVLARFFEGKKFREIAKETRSSEAACKVRLRRVMDKIAVWLSGRGVTLSVATLMTLLGTEWGRACPPTLMAKSSSVFSGETAPRNFHLSNILTTMKISKMTATGLILIIGASMVIGLTEGITKGEQAKRELVTWSAFQQAGQAGLNPGSLKELVPEYLPKVPVNASTGEPFTYDPEEKTMNFSSEE